MAEEVEHPANNRLLESDDSGNDLLVPHEPVTPSTPHVPNVLHAGQSTESTNETFPHNKPTDVLGVRTALRTASVSVTCALAFEKIQERQNHAALV